MVDKNSKKRSVTSKSKDKADSQKIVKSKKENGRKMVTSHAEGRSSDEQDSIKEDESSNAEAEKDDEHDDSSKEIGQSEDSGSESEADKDSAEEQEEESDDESYPDPKKRKKNKDDGSGSFADAFNSILGSHLKAYDRKDPIMVRNKSTEKALESEKLELKAKKALLAEKKQIYDKHHIQNLLPSADEPESARFLLEKERKLKKIAQKGVVRLFNAVISTQVQTNQKLNQTKGLGESSKEELMNEMSKETFLDLVQAAGKS